MSGLLLRIDARPQLHGEEIIGGPRGHARHRDDEAEQSDGPIKWGQTPILRLIFHLKVDAEAQFHQPAALDAVRHQIARAQRIHAARNCCRVQKIIEVYTRLDHLTGGSERPAETGIKLVQIR